jgi:hypothetical protein
MAASANSVATLDTRSYLERALAHGFTHGLLAEAHRARMQEEGAKALVQIANHFGTAYLRANLETALVRFANLASLYLEDRFGSDLHAAACSLRDNTLLSHSRGGSELLKQLHVMPETTLLTREAPRADSQRQFLDDYSFSSPMTAATYRTHRAARVENQLRVAFAFWIGKKLAADESELSFSSAEEVLRSAVLVCHAGLDPLRLPTRSVMARLIAEVRKKTFKPQPERWQRLLRDAPPDYQRIGEAILDDFRGRLLPLLKSKKWTAEDVIAGAGAGTYFVDDSLDEDLAHYEQIVATEWTKATGGRNDPDTLATVFLRLAAGMPPKPSLLLREAKALIGAVRANGFDSAAVVRFIETCAPLGKQEGLLHMWQGDLLPEAEGQLADLAGDDTKMVRALKYLRECCIANWKSAGA